MKQYKYGNKQKLTLYVISMSLLSLVGGISLYAMKFITDYAISGQMDKLTQLAQYMLLLLIVHFAFKRVVTKTKEAYIYHSIKDLKQAYVHNLFNLDLLTISQNDQEVYLTQLSNDMDRYEERYYLNLVYVIELVLQLVVSMLILVSIHYLLFFLALLLLVFFANVANKTSKPIAAQETKKSKSLEKYTNYVKQTLDGFIVIKQNLLQEKSKEEFKDIAQNVQNDNYDLDKKTSQIDALNSLLQFLTLFTLIFVGLIFAKKQNLSLGTTILAGTAFANTTWPMQTISPMLTQMKGVGAVLTGFSEKLKQKNVNETESITKVKELKFEDVSLGYEQITILEHVNIMIKENEKVLIVGESGAGKSTILKTIRRQLEQQKGRITCNGIPLSKINAIDYFSQLSVVDQIGFIFNASVTENITLYSEVGEDEIKALLNEVGLIDLDHELILRNNGDNLSGGQRARLMLARALYMDSSLIVCDEILASLDTTVANQIEKDILDIKGTVVNVSHIYYEENLDYYDKIYEVKQGHVSLINKDKLLK